MTFLNTLSMVLAVLTCLCFSYQLLYQVLPLLRKYQPRSTPKPHRYAVLIAARNEEAVLPHLLDSIHAQDYPSHLVTTYVIADNCTDRTAAVAAARGARVFQRFNTTQVGKGYALNYLLEQIRISGEFENYDAFLVFDADNLLCRDYITRINRVCSDGYESFCGYRNTKNYGANWLSAGYGLWYLHESAFLNQSRMLLGGCCAASGTGFGFTRALLERMGGWNFFTLTEDIEFRTWCATHGVAIGYCHDAVLYDEQPTSLRVSVRQRTRWIQGGAQVSLRYGTDYLRGIFRGGRTGWASFEAATLSLWGYGLSAASFLCALLTACAAGDGLRFLLTALALGYASVFLTGALTMATEHRRIRATRGQKIRSLFTYPLYVAAYIPTAAVACFRKPQWKPIPHTAAISLQELS